MADLAGGSEVNRGGPRLSGAAKRRFRTLVRINQKDAARPRRLSGEIRQQCSNPFTRRSLPGLLPPRILVSRPGATFQQELDDCRLLPPCLIRTAAAAAGGLD